MYGRALRANRRIGRQLAPRFGKSVSAAASYSTLFPSTENPISEGGVWANGGSTGLDWQNVQTTPGKAFGVGASAGYDDCNAVLQGRFSTTRHYSQGTIRKLGGYTPPSSHETELLLGFSISAHVAAGYEVDMWFDGTLQFVRWNGALSDFTVYGTGDWLDSSSGSGFGRALVEDDVVKATFDASSGHPVLTLYLNGAQVSQVPDTSASKITSGSPGMGFFARAGSGLDMTAYCLKAFAAGSL